MKKYREFIIEASDNDGFKKQMYQLRDDLRKFSGELQIAISDFDKKAKREPEPNVKQQSKSGEDVIKQISNYLAVIKKGVQLSPSIKDLTDSVEAIESAWASGNFEKKDYVIKGLNQIKAELNKSLDLNDVKNLKNKSIISPVDGIDKVIDMITSQLPKEKEAPIVSIRQQQRRPAYQYAEVMERSVQEIEKDLTMKFNDAEDNIQNIEIDQQNIDRYKEEIETLKSNIEKLQIDGFEEDNKQLVLDKIEQYKQKIEETQKKINSFQDKIKALKDNNV